MKIIALKPRRKSLTGVEFDQPVEPKLFLAETDAAGLIALDSELCEMKRLSAGMELTDEELESLVSQSHIKRAKSRAMWYLSRSSYPKAGLIKKLCASFPDYAAEAAADRMMAAFVRKGFSVQTVKRALEEAGEDVFDTENTEF